MTLRRRLTLLAAVSVAVAIVAAAVGSYVAVRAELRGQIDDSLRAATGRFVGSAGAGGILSLDQSLHQVEELPAPPPGAIAAPALGDGGVFVQLIPAGGGAQQPPGSPSIPVSAEDRRIAESGEGERLTDATVGGQHLRVITAPVEDQGAVQIGRALSGVDDVLGDLRVILVLVCLAGIGVAALIARLLAQRVLAPVADLTETAEHVAATDDLSRRIEVDREDELGRLATRFNAMLDAIEGSQEALTRSLTAQSQLIADTSHELRTPIASLRTDVESLIDHPELEPAERERRLGAVSERAEELTALVNDVIELARGDQPADAFEELRLDELVAASIERLERLAPAREIEARLDQSVIEGRPDRIARAVNNLLDNAHKYSPVEEPIEVEVGGGTVVVRDHGPGLTAEEVAHAFDRFWRGAESRRAVGSGLGLAIVRRVAESHGGEVTAANANGGGAEFRLSFRLEEPAKQWAVQGSNL
jgi:two-component system, OmpR family, sensor histidine kinase MprB